MKMNEIPVECEDAAMLRDAIDVLMRQGWAQDMMEDFHGRVCMVGAIGKACAARMGEPVGSLNLTPAVNGALFAVQRVLYYRENGVDGLSTLTAWNDTHGRTREQVIAVLRAAANRLEEGR